MRRTTFDCAHCGYHGPGKDFRVAKHPGTNRTLECRRPIHKGSNWPYAWSCPQCHKATCHGCELPVDPAVTKRAERKALLVAFTWFAVAAAALVVWWSPWDSPPPRQSSSYDFDYSPDPHHACQSAYENDYHPAWADAEAVKQLPGCSGWLPPAPGRLPGYDQDCSDLTGPVRVDMYDRYELDADGDGIGCEPYEG